MEPYQKPEPYQEPEPNVNMDAAPFIIYNKSNIWTLQSRGKCFRSHLISLIKYEYEVHFKLISSSARAVPGAEVASKFLPGAEAAAPLLFYL
jgi:hypothetical protein